MLFVFFNDTATTEIYTLSLHDALPICSKLYFSPAAARWLSARYAFFLFRSSQMFELTLQAFKRLGPRDRKSTRLNSSHSQISYAVFCLKKKNSHITRYTILPHSTIHA